MNDNNSLFGDLENFSLWKKEWKDMPEFIQEDLSPWRTIDIIFEDYFDKKGYLIKDRIIRVHFENIDNLRDFSNKLLNIGIKGINHTTKLLQFSIGVNKLSEIVGQKITDLTRSIWFPEAEIWTSADKLYIDEP